MRNPKEIADGCEEHRLTPPWSVQALNQKVVEKDFRLQG
jgi:hypothetical protein